MSKSRNRGAALAAVCVFACLFVFAVLPAAADTQGDYEYTVSNGQATIVKYLGGGGEVIIPAKMGKYPVKTIGMNAFAGYTLTELEKADRGITKVTIPKGVTAIESFAFIMCMSLREVVLPQTLVSIGRAAFMGCDSMESITLPASLKSIDLYCFGGVKLQDIQVAKGSKSFASVDGALYSKDMKRLFRCPPAYAGDTFAVPESVEEIYSSAFSNCTRLTRITFPARLRDMGEGVFGDCESLVEIALPEGISRIGKDTFMGCSKLKRVVLPEGVKQIEVNAFFDCTALEEVLLPGTVTDISSQAFAGCESLRSIRLPFGLQTVGTDVFYMCKSLTSVEIPDSVTRIGPGAFAGCTSLKRVVVPASVLEIDALAFLESGKFVMEGYEGSYASRYAKQNNIPFTALPPPPLKLLSAAADAAEGAVGQTIIWRASAAGGSEGRTYAFTVLCGGEPAAESGVLESAEFAWLPLAPGTYSARVTVKSGAEEASAETGPVAVREMDAGKLFKYKVSGKAVTITSYIGEGGVVLVPETIKGRAVTVLAAYAFSDNDAITRVILPDTIQTIQNNAFTLCRNLTAVNIPASLQEVGDFAFSGCRLKGALVFPDSVRRIGKRAFSGCAGILSAQIPGETQIGPDAFAPGTYFFVEEGSPAHRYAAANFLPVSFAPIDLDLSGLQTVEEVVAWVVMRYTAPGMDDYQKALALHDWLIGHADYTTAPWETEDFTAEKILLQGIGVCSGYTQAYQLLLTQAGIACETVGGIAGGLHAWNLVRMNGDWYHVDCTWDDSGIGESRRYFGLSDAAIQGDHQDYDAKHPCDAYACNFFYRSGALDGCLDKARKEIGANLKKGRASFTVTASFEGVWGSQGSIAQIVLAALRDTDWSAFSGAAKVSLSIVDSGERDALLQVTMEE